MIDALWAGGVLFLLIIAIGWVLMYLMRDGLSDLDQFDIPCDHQRKAQLPDESCVLDLSNQHGICDKADAAVHGECGHLPK